jgi:hypothetical protein
VSEQVGIASTLIERSLVAFETTHLEWSDEPAIA